MGMKQASTYANLDGGGYAWAKFGFKYATQSDAENHQNGLHIRMKSSFSNASIEPNNLAKLQTHVSDGNIALPNQDGTKTVRPFTEDDHKALKLEIKALTTIFSNPHRESLWEATNLNTPMLNAICSARIKSVLGGDDKRPSFIKMIAHDTSWNAHLDMKDPAQMQVVKSYFESGGG
jgi:hypothetical protein